MNNHWVKRRYLHAVSVEPYPPCTPTEVRVQLSNGHVYKSFLNEDGILSTHRVYPLDYFHLVDLEFDVVEKEARNVFGEI